MSLAEKFQITIPPKYDVDDNGGWVSQNQARNVGEVGQLHKNNKTIDENVVIETNLLPPGMEITNTKYKRIEDMPLSMAGQTDITGMVNFKNPKFLEQGYNRLDMKSTDDQYDGEHVDLFYGEAKDELGNVGFVERNNYCDRS